MTSAAEPELLRIRQVAERYGLTERHVRQLVAERTIPYYKPGKIVLIPRAEFEAWLREQRVEAI